MVAHIQSTGQRSGWWSESDHPGASRHPSCTRRGALLATGPLDPQGFVQKNS